MTTNTFTPPAGVFRNLIIKAFTEVMVDMGYPARQAQREYALRVADEMLLEPRYPEKAKEAGARPNVGLIEGPPGIGKSQGYLIPTMLWSALARKQGSIQRGLVTTHTLALQDQLVGKSLLSGRQPSFADGDRSDLAVAIEVVRRLTGVTVTVAFRKGKQSYIDANRARRVLASLTDDAEAVALLKWIATFPERPDDTASNDEWAAFHAACAADPFQGLLPSWLNDGHSLPYGIDATDLVMSDGSEPNANPWYEANKMNARTMDVVVVSHAMALVDIMAGGRVLADEGVGPATDFAIVIHDEADMLVSVAEGFSRHRVRPMTIRNLLKDNAALFTNPPDDQGMGSPLVAARDLLMLRTEETEDFFAETYNDLVERGVFRKDDQIKERPLAPDDRLARQAVQYANNLIDGIRTLSRQIGETLTEPPKVKRRGEAVRRELADMADHLSRFVSILTARGAEEKEDSSDTKEGPSDIDDRMTALSWSPKRSLASFEVLRMNPGRIFSANWFLPSDHRYVLLTSATLRVPAGGKGSEWGYIKDALGAYVAVNPYVYSPTHFGAIDRVVLTVLDNADGANGPFLYSSDSTDDSLDEETKPYNQQWQALALLGARRMAATDESGLLLTASYKDVDWLAETLADDPAFWLHRHGTRLKDGIEALQSGRARVLVTPAAWAGHNIRAANGEQIIRHVGILRLPYPPPDDSMRACLEVKLRRQGKTDSRGNLIDPHKEAGRLMHLRSEAGAMHKFIQGVGRGIRATNDVMTLWILDPRFKVHRDVLACGDPQLFPITHKAASDFEKWHRTLPERFREILADPLKVVLLVGRDGRGPEVLVPKPGMGTNDFLL